MNGTFRFQEMNERDRLLAALAYPLPMLAVAALVSDEMRARPFLKFHALQSLVLAAALAAVGLLFGLATFGLGFPCATLAWVAAPLWPAYHVYTRGAYEIPVIAGFIRGQGWVDTQTRTGEQL
jgi:uncharacterized membrane protein